MDIISGVKYYDEAIDRMLMLFLYKGEKFGRMQVWKVTGICFAEDWTEEQEESGQIRFWLKTKICDSSPKWIGCQISGVAGRGGKSTGGLQ